MNSDYQHKKLKRSDQPMIGGVCGGIAEYFNVDPTLVRAIYVILTVISAGFPGIIIYILLWIIIPPKTPRLPE